MVRSYTLEKPSENSGPPRHLLLALGGIRRDANHQKHDPGLRHLRRSPVALAPCRAKPCCWWPPKAMFVGVKTIEWYRMV